MCWVSLAINIGQGWGSFTRLHSLKRLEANLRILTKEQDILVDVDTEDEPSFIEFLAVHLSSSLLLIFHS